MQIQLTEAEVSCKDMEANKGVRGMPWLSKETKDVESCEKLRGVAIEH